MSRKSNKTDHVMRLITKDPSVSGAEEVPEVSLSETEADEPVEMPDGVPFERRHEDIMTSVLDSADKASARVDSLDEVRDSIRRDEIKRAEKNEYLDQILGGVHKVTNLSEVLAMEILPSIIDRLGGCKCPVCTANILALALNMLPPRYITTNEGKQYMKLLAYKSQHELDVIQAITKACLKVMSSPRHSIGD